jgi:hypothetical protein
VFLASAAGVGAYQKFENWGKPKRWDVDKWDRRMMERDSRLTGNVNFQIVGYFFLPHFLSGKCKSASRISKKLCF